MPEGAPPDPAEEMDRPAGRHPSGLESQPSGRHRARWVWVAAVVAVVGVLTALFGFGLANDPSLIDSPLVGRPAPPFDLRTLDGSGSLSLSSLRGHVVVLNFWASWCGPCRQEHPDLQAAWTRYRTEGVVVVGVSYQDSAAAGRAFSRSMGGDWPLLSDPGSQTALAFGVTGVPETFVIDRAGRVAAKFYGPVDYGELSDRIVPLLGGSGR